MEYSIKQFYKSVDVLVTAYNNGTLIHQSCAACAVGNLVMAACDYTTNSDFDEWITTDGKSLGRIYTSRGLAKKSTAWYSAARCQGYNDDPALTEIGKTQIASTGYTPEDIYKIEKAFELTRGFPKPASVHALVRVITCLAEIHKLPDDELERALICVKQNLN